MAAGAVGALAQPALADPGEPFDYEVLVEKARQRAAEPFEDTRTVTDDRWASMDFDQYRKIRFRPENAIWRDERLFSLQFFHPGFLYTQETPVYAVRNGMATPFVFDPAMFDYGDLDVAEASVPTGFAGFRVHYPLHSDSIRDEFAVFLGASYFRLIGRNQVYGISGRGLAINTGTPEGEEFPAFVAFWVEEPAADGTDLTFYALMDSPSIAGAYRFRLLPRTESQIKVTATLFPRDDIQKVGLAPLTSMYLFGENDREGFDDFRPEVHDSDGLMMHTGNGEWLWRPLVNPGSLQISSMLDTNPRAFGLAQRDRDYASYQDLESNYETRPGIWVEPLGAWGSGHVELVEIPSNAEIHDNIVAYWVSDQPFVAGESRVFEYQMTAFGDHVTWPPGARVESTRIGSADRPGAESPAEDGARLFVIDFGGGDLPFLEEDQPVEARVSSSSGTIANVTAHKIPATGGWRAFFDFTPDGDEPVTLRCFLHFRGHTLSETWTYLWAL